MELSELEWACRAAAHIPRHPDGRYVLSLLKRLLPEPRRAATTRPPSTSMPATAAPKVLLVDDSEITLELMQAQLEGSGYEVRIAVALGEIRAIVANWAPNVIVADVKRPDMPGVELCARIKASVRRDDVLVLLCSSLPDAELAELARISRADGFVSKLGGLSRFFDQLHNQIQRLLLSTPVERASASEGM
jgi:CheY-like chemotaxis protein